jgi:non-heme chloroperoxidase
VWEREVHDDRRDVAPKSGSRLVRVRAYDRLVSLAVRSIELSDELTLPYVEKGDPSGVPMILLHALADSWRSFEVVLAQLPVSIHVFAPTQRGHGDAGRPDSGYQPRDFAADLTAFMNALDIEGAVIVGGSSGGLIARRFAIDNPERTLGLALLGSPRSLRDTPGVMEMWDSTLSRLTDPIDPAFVREFAASTLAKPITSEFLESVVQENLKVPARVWIETTRGLLDDDSVDELDRITAPTLILWGDQDAILPRSDQEALASAIPNARLVIYPGSGHALYWEEPQRVAHDLVAFAQSLGWSG